MDDLTVADLMTEPVLTVERDERPGDVARALMDAGIKSVVVIDEDCYPIGILTSTDYVALTADGVDPYDTTVGAEMTDGIVTVSHDESVPAAALKMNDHDIGHLPVVNDQGETVGILTGTDLTGYLADDA